MYIFIDESGGFQVPVKAKPHAISCVAALVIPENFAKTLFTKFRRIIRPWKGSGREVKGSQLTEEQVATILKLLKRFDVIVIAACLDMGLHTKAGIEAHKNEQAECFLEAAQGTKPEMRRDLEDLSARIRALSNQLYAQAMVLNEVVRKTYLSSTLYYVQRIPSTLGSFKWRVDAKDTAITNYEKLWMKIVLPALQTHSLREPMVQLKGADYSAFSKFEKTLPEPPLYLKVHANGSTP